VNKTLHKGHTIHPQSYTHFQETIKHKIYVLTYLPPFQENTAAAIWIPVWQQRLHDVYTR